MGKNIFKINVRLDRQLKIYCIGDCQTNCYTHNSLDNSIMKLTCINNEGKENCYNTFQLRELISKTNDMNRKIPIVSDKECILKIKIKHNNVSKIGLC